MQMKSSLILVLACLLAATLSGDATADVKYGPWYNTGECRPARAPAIIGSGPPIPSVGRGAQECKYCRTVESCSGASRLRPFRCVLRQPKCTGYRLGPPPN